MNQKLFHTEPLSIQASGIVTPDPVAGVSACIGYMIAPWGMLGVGDMQNYIDYLSPGGPGHNSETERSRLRISTGYW